MGSFSCINKYTIEELRELLQDSIRKLWYDTGAIYQLKKLIQNVAEWETNLVDYKFILNNIKKELLLCEATAQANEENIKAYDSRISELMIRQERKVAH